MEKPQDWETRKEIYKDLREQLYSLLSSRPKVLLLGIGENRMGDDGTGPFIAFHLYLEIKHPKIKIINGGILPEERLDEIVEFKPDLLILIDAIQNNRPPGTVALYDEKRMMNYLPISSHSLPLPIFVDRCKRKIPGLKVKLLGLTPFALEFLEYYKLFEEDKYDLDAKDNDPNIPFYAFNFTAQMMKVNHEVIWLLKELLEEIYFTE